MVAFGARDRDKVVMVEPPCRPAFPFSTTHRKSDVLLQYHSQYSLQGSGASMDIGVQDNDTKSRLPACLTGGLLGICWLGDEWYCSSQHPDQNRL